MGYTYIEDEVGDLNINFSRYSINSLKHHVTSRLSTQLVKNINFNVIYKHAERTSGMSYNVWDASMVIAVKQFEFTLTAANMFNEDYIETGFVPMPPSNVLFGMQYRFN